MTIIAIKNGGLITRRNALMTDCCQCKCFVATEDIVSVELDITAGSYFAKRRNTISTVFVTRFTDGLHLNGTHSLILASSSSSTSPTETRSSSVWTKTGSVGTRIPGVTGGELEMTEDGLQLVNGGIQVEFSATTSTAPQGSKEEFGTVVQVRLFNYFSYIGQQSDYFTQNYFDVGDEVVWKANPSLYNFPAFGQGRTASFLTNDPPLGVAPAGEYVNRQPVSIGSVLGNISTRTICVDGEFDFSDSFKPQGLAGSFPNSWALSTPIFDEESFSSPSLSINSITITVSGATYNPFL